MASRNTADLTQGAVFQRLLRFTLPLLATNLLQQLYHAADVAVVGRFAGETSLAAVGATSGITTLLLNIFIGLAIGANVVCANLYGARKQESLSRCMHTAMLLSLVCGIGIAIIGIALAPSLLRMMSCPDTVIPQAVLYMRLYFLGVPASLIYNFGAGILRAHGDTKRPMIILSCAGIINVALNLIFVIFCHWGVAGVAIATMISQIVSAIAILVLLLHPSDVYRLQLKKMRFYKKELMMIIRFGIPCGLNGAVFSISNVVLQSTVNTFGDIYIAAAAASSSMTSFVYSIINAFYTASVSFAGQNYGARKFDRIDKTILYASGCSVIMVFAASTLITAFCPMLLGLYAKEVAVIRAATIPLMIMVWTYPLYAVAETAIGCLRGMGQSTAPTILNAFCITAPRILWVLAVFPLKPTFPFLYISYPISWAICAAVQVWYYLHCRRQLQKITNTSTTI